MKLQNVFSIAILVIAVLLAERFFGDAWGQDCKYTYICMCPTLINEWKF